VAEAVIERTEAVFWGRQQGPWQASMKVCKRADDELK
jgi:hypothetical protein